MSASTSWSCTGLSSCSFQKILYMLAIPGLLVECQCDDGVYRQITQRVFQRLVLKISLRNKRLDPHDLIVPAKHSANPGRDAELLGGADVGEGIAARAVIRLLLIV